MLYNYLQVAIRNLTKYKLHSLINIFGLALGLASLFLILIYIKFETSYDRFHENAVDLYRITWEDENPQTRTPHPMAQALVADFPEVVSSVSVTPLWGPGLTRETHSFRNLEKDERYDEKNILMVDTTFFNVFDFPLLKGNPKTALKNVNGVLISESMERKYFGGDDAMGKHLAVDSDTLLVEVVGVFKDVPGNSHFHFDFLVSYLREKSFDPDDEFWTWADFGHYNYIRMRPGGDPKALESQLLHWVRKHISVTDEVIDEIERNNYGFRVQPVTDIHLQSRLRWELEPNGNLEYVYILGAAAFLIIIIACVNFMNLTTARSAERAKEIGIRKSLGAFRRQLSLQFLSESVMVAILAALIAVLIIEMSLPFFNAVSGLDLALNYREHVFILVGIAVTIGLLSGLYPAFYLSSARPHVILKGRTLDTPRGKGFRMALITLQFTISMVLISSSMIIYDQLKFLMNKDLGFEKEGVLIVPIKNDHIRSGFDALRNELLDVEGIQKVSGTSNVPGFQFNQNPITASKDPSNNIASSETYIDYDFFDVLEIELKDGRTFLRENAADTSAVSFVINETAARNLNLDSPVGEEIQWDISNTTLTGNIIGVVEDFHFQSLHEPIRPLLFVLYRDYNYLLIRMEMDDIDEKLTSIKDIYTRFDNVFVFEYSFLKDDLVRQYSSESKMAKLFGVFSVIAILIACFGLFGMAMLAFQQKTKEISIRKVLGAPVVSLLSLLLGDFTRLIVIAIVLATPMAWWIMRNWLDNFTYKSTIGPDVFVWSGLALLAIAWGTLSYLTWKTTRLNPAETLKNE